MITKQTARNYFQSVVLACALLAGILTPTFMAMASAAASNLISNPSAETVVNGTPTNWTPDNWGTSTSTLKTTADAHTGVNALSVTTTSRTSGDAKWAADAVAVTPGQTYTYTDYSKATVTTQLVAAYANANGAISYVSLGTVQASTAWQANSANFTVPSGITKVQILHILATAGSLTTDDFSIAQQAAAPIPPAGSNLIANPSMETANGIAPSGWQSDTWGTNTTNFSHVATDAHTGTKSAMVQVSNYTDGDAKWFFTPVIVLPGTSYTFSDYYKATTTSYLVARFDNGSGVYTYSDLSTLSASTSWTQASVTFTTPATAKYVTILHLIESNGTLQTDDASLIEATSTPPTTPGTTNVMPNPSLETPDPANSKLPQGWQHGNWGTNTTTFSYPATGHTGTRSAKVLISAYTNGAAYWHTAPLPVTGGQMYNYSDYYMSSIPSEVDATVTLKDGTEQDLYLGTAFRSPSVWTKFSTQFTLPANAASITIYHDIYSVGNLTTDDYSLTPFSYQGFNRPLVSITDDDGFASFYNNGLPTLQKYGLPSTEYMISGYVGTAKYMTVAQLKSLAAAGVEIGSHSVSHPDLSTLSATSQDNQLKNSQTSLQTRLGFPITDYAAPYGAYNQQIVTDAQKYYQSYRGVQAGYNAKNNFDPMNIRVQNIVASTTTAQVQGWLQQAAATNTWLVLVYHEIDTAPTDTTYNTTPANFDAQMQAVKNSGLTVKTVAQALTEVTSQL